MATLPVAIEIAAHWHGQQKDKGGEWYIIHPIRVMLGLDTEQERIVAVLHDVIEDTKCKYSDLIAAGFSDVVIEGIKSVTKLPGETYGEAIIRAYNNQIGRKVKMRDIEQNSNVLRLPYPLSPHNLHNLGKYAISYAFLSGHMTLDEFKEYGLQ